jgi:hypothetical protein
MKPVPTKYTNATLAPPVHWDEKTMGKCVPLPVCNNEPPYMFSWWKASWWERLAILFGRPVRVCIIAAQHPAISVDIWS